MIFRLGDVESVAGLNRRRLQTMKNYIVKVKPEVQAVFAEGERKHDFGVIDLYLEGELLYRLPLFRNKDIDLTSCIAA